jgi:hypothetical protein
MQATANRQQVFDSIHSPEHELWRAHRRLLKTIPVEEVGYRGCVAMAMVVEDSGMSHGIEWGGGVSFIANRDALWLTLQAMPRSFWRTAPNRPVDLAVVRRATSRFGMPSLNQHGVQAMFDFHRMPFDAVQCGDETVTPDAETLNSGSNEHWFRVFNALEWAMTTTAFAYRTKWAKYRTALCNLLKIEQNNTPYLMFGDGVYDKVQHPMYWMPRPYLAFPAGIRSELWNRSTQRSVGSDHRHYTNSFKLAFIADLEKGLPITAPCDGRLVAIRRDQFKYDLPVLQLVFHDAKFKEHSVFVHKRATLTMLKGAVVHRGQQVGTEACRELPQNWNELGLYARWEVVMKHALSQLPESHLHLWFDRQLYSLTKKFVHVDASLCALAALGNAVDDRLYWEIGKAMPYFNSTVEAFVFPTVRISTWDHLRWSLPGDVEVDLLPDDPRFVTPKKVAKPRKVFNKGKNGPRKAGKPKRDVTAT